MSDTVIRVENLGKKYLIRHEQRERYVALRDVIANKVKSFSKRLFRPQPQASNAQPSKEEFWALRDINFEVHQGDRIGIIGRNGAGKTTLLKLLSRITEPTTGRIAIRGRVASLLEVGTGFHPELTGRENIFLNGAILGMGKAEIKKKFDEIVDFAEIEKFLDTPVKRYSSGMYLRLAFAVAAHLEPEILLVDEVLAVGDAQFQKKCLGKMEDVSAIRGRSVLFVSHNLAAVRSLCNRGILLDQGHIIFDGEIDEASNIYEELTCIRDDSTDLIFLMDDIGTQINYWPTNKSCTVGVRLTNVESKDVKSVDISLWANNVMISSASSDRLQEIVNFKENDEVIFTFPIIPLATKQMSIDVGFRGHDGKYLKLIEKAGKFDVEPNMAQFYFDSRLVTQFPVKCEVKRIAV
jgi:ABC-type polysaccharide/polyol phosphate transport system ATPase subunit